mgnify:CR=1 FL=1
MHPELSPKATEIVSHARALLDDWGAAGGRFVKIVPVDYRRALTELEAAAVAAE